MSTIVVQAFITLDGVVQSAGGPDEDREGGFEHGGWQDGYNSGEDGEVVGEWESRTEALLLGRRTYEIFAGSSRRLPHPTAYVDANLNSP